MLRFSIPLLLFVVQLAPVPTYGAGGRAHLVSHQEARRFGLERAWFTRVGINSAIGRIADITQHVSSTTAYTVYEVTFPGATLRFSERDVDRFGAPIGKARAQKLALRKVDDLKQAGREATLTEQTVPDIALYVSTDRGIVQAVDGETGRTRWVSETGLPGLAISSPAANDDFVAVINGSHLYLLNASDGKIAWHRRTRRAPSGGPTLTDDLLLVPMLGGTVESYALNDLQRTPWVFQGSGRIARPVFNGDIVAWPTDRGHLYIGQGDMNNMLFQIETGGPIVAPAAALHPNRLVTVSLDGYVYCVEEETGSILWRFSTGERISETPLVIGERIYIVTEESNLFRIDARNVNTSDEEAWPAISGITRLLAASGDRLYCVDELGRILIVDAETGTRLGTMPAIAPDVRVSNLQTDRIFVATRGGFLQCLHEIKNKWPVLHLDAAELPAPSEDAQQTAATAGDGSADSDTAPAETDPFGAPLTSESDAGAAAEPADDSNPFGGDTDPFDTDSDPFGAGDSEADPFGSASDDPFGAP